MKLSQIIAALPSLAPADRKALKAALAQFDEPTDIDTELWQIVLGLTHQKGVLGERYKAIWLLGEAEVNNLVALLTKGQTLNRVSMRAVKRFLLDLVIRDLQREGITVTVLTVCHGMQAISELFENAYPGYLKAGLGFRLVKSLLKGGADG